MDEYSGGLLSEHQFPETDNRPVIFPNVDASDNGKRVRGIRREVIGDVTVTVAEFADGGERELWRNPSWLKHGESIPRVSER